MTIITALCTLCSKEGERERAREKVKCGSIEARGRDR